MPLLAVLVAVGLLVTLRRITPASVEPRFELLTFRSGFVSRALFIPNSNAILYAASWDGQPIRTYHTLPETVGFDRSLDADVQFPLTYTADGSQLLVLLGVDRAATIVRGTLAWWPALGGRPRPIMESAGWADWAPRGRFLVVVRDTGAERIVEVRDANGQTVRSVYKTSGGIAWLRISPDERSAAFVHYPGLYEQVGEIWTVALDGSSGTALTPLFQQCWGLEWNHATRELWFAGSRSGGFSNALWAVNLRKDVRLVLPLAEIFILNSISSDGHRVLLLKGKDTAGLAVRAADKPLQSLKWFGWSVVSDLSPDARTLLFYDGGAVEATWGTWLRPVDGGDAVRLGEGVQSRFSADGRSVISVVTEPPDPPQLVLMPVGAGERRRLTSPPAAYQWPSFADATTLLFVRTDAGNSEVWRMATDGTDGRSLGIRDCDMPAASPRHDQLACVGGTDRRELRVYPMNGGAGRIVYKRETGGRFRYLAWRNDGRSVFAATSDRHLLTLDVASGHATADELLPYPEAGQYDSLLSAALSGDGTLQAYSVIKRASELYLVSNLK